MFQILFRKYASEGQRPCPNEREKESGTLTDRKRQLERHVLQIFHTANQLDRVQWRVYHRR